MEIEGYVFNGWSTEPERTAPYVQKTDMDATAVTDDIVYYACYTPKTDTTYTVQHYQEKQDGTYV